MAGVLQQVASLDGAPALPNFQIGDLLGGTQAAVCGVLAGLLGAQRSGRGRFVDVSMTHEVWRHQIAVAAGARSERSRAPRPAAICCPAACLATASIAPATAAALAVGALELKFWRSLCETLGRPEWAGRHWSLGQQVGGDDAMALRAELQALLQTQPMVHWAMLFEPADCCVTPVLRPEEAAEHPLFAGHAGRSAATG